MNKAIDEILKEYRVNKAKVRCGELEIDGIEEYIRSGRMESREMPTETIEAMSISAKPLSDIPASKTNKFHSIVEDVAIGYWDEWAKKPPTREELQERISNIKSRIYLIRQEVTLVEEVLLPCLGQKERFIIECLYVDGYSWNDIVKMYSGKYEAREYETLKTMRNYAMKKMQDVISLSA